MDRFTNCDAHRPYQLVREGTAPCARVPQFDLVVVQQCLQHRAISARGFSMTSENTSNMGLEPPQGWRRDFYAKSTVRTGHASSHGWAGCPSASIRSSIGIRTITSTFMRDRLGK